MSILKMPWPRNGHLHFYNLLKEHWRWIQRTMFHLDYEKRAKGLPLSTHFDFCNSQNVSKTRTPDSNFYSLVLNLFARWMVPPWNVNFKLSQTSPPDQTKYNFIMIRLFHFQLFFPGGQVRGQAQKQNRRLKVHYGPVLYIQCDWPRRIETLLLSIDTWRRQKA